MTVDAGSRVGHLFCEGKPNSLDIMILNRLVPGPAFKVVPSGGKFGLPSFIDGYMAGETPQGPCLGFRDRDFDAEPTPACALIRAPQSPRRQIYLSHRSCIESYLLDPALIHRYWERSSEGPSWSHGDPPAVDEIRVWIQEAGREIAEYQAVRWALAKLKPGSRWPVIETTWMPSSGELPTDLDFDSCLYSARELVVEYGRAVAQVNVAALDAHAGRYRSLFGEEAFWKGDSYMLWFHGKDVQKAMQRKRPNSISLNSFCRWAAENMNWKQHPDLVELSTLLSSGAPSPPTS